MCPSLPLRPCASCGAEFQAKAGNQKFCSKPCFWRAKKRRAIDKRAVVRAAAHPPCWKCGTTYQPRMSTQRYCSPECRPQPPKGSRRGTCRICTTTCEAFVCTSCSMEAIRRGRRRYQARKRGATIQEVYEPSEIYHRDGGRCQLCGRKVARKRRFANDPNGPSIDHIIPLSKGGDDTKANVQLAHFGCNSAKNNKAAGEQLRLIG